jgi:HEAT repeat protein
MVEKSDPLIEKLIQRLRDPDPVVRRNAAGALRLHGRRARGAVGELRERLTDDDASVRAEAAKALDRLRQAAA